MFKFKLIKKDGTKTLFEVTCDKNPNYNIYELETIYNGTWYTPTKNGLKTLNDNISDESIRKALITALHYLDI